VCFLIFADYKWLGWKYLDGGLLTHRKMLVKYLLDIIFNRWFALRLFYTLILNTLYFNNTLFGNIHLTLSGWHHVNAQIRNAYDKNKYHLTDFHLAALIRDCLSTSFRLTSTQIFGILVFNWLKNIACLWIA